MACFSKIQSGHVRVYRFVSLRWLDGHAVSSIEDSALYYVSFTYLIHFIAVFVCLPNKVLMFP